MTKYSFRTQTFLFFAVVLFVSQVVLFTTYNSLMKTDIREEAGTRAVQRLELARWFIENNTEPMSMRDFNIWARQLAKKLHSRLTYIVDGTVVADSDVPVEDVEKLEDHSHRPEVIEAVQDGHGMSTRYSSTLGKRLIYVASRMKKTSTLPAGILRLAIPESLVESHQSEVTRNFIIILAIALVLTGGVSFFISGNLSRAIRRLADSARAIGQGEWDRRIHVVPGVEFQPLAEAINVMAENITVTFHDLQEKRLQIEAMLNGMAEGVLVLDGQGRIRHWNSALQSIFPDVGSHEHVTVLELSMNPELHAAIEATKQGEAQENHIQVFINNKYLDVSIEKYNDPSKESGFVLVFHDITYIRKLEEVRRDFVTNVSHELRTPITSIQGYAETLLDNPPSDPEIAADFQRRIMKNASHISSMVDDLLRLSRIENGSDSRDLYPVDLYDVVTFCFDVISPLAEKNEVQLISHLEENEVCVLGHKKGLIEIFTNCIENAVKYMDKPGHVTISAELGELTASIRIEDTGPGIPRDHLERVFERFYRCGRSCQQKSGSSGLGLAITKGLIRRFGGMIEIQSPVGTTDRGCAVLLTLTRATVCPSPLSENVEALVGGQDRNKV
ncbi:HAMP domain-containing sensor histidine kinase [Desulfovibrio inopinatus]|uniref:HAMP domain-containing sensor histidine kinase n=1 Tax=Desulfovibrio inopinatus TaxID=102109 RepID=UPI0012EBEF59|nr:HAMP domain-containing sensor histidine kinase [Desulfovibrio inopinatus]